MYEKVFEIYIRASPERLWEVITDPETRGKYQFGNRISSDLKPGTPRRPAPHARSHRVLP